MIPIKLIIDNFSCYERSEIDFTQFSAALIVGRNQGNDSLSNGVGKTTVFKALEYVLFNESEESLERVIRDDCNSCKVIFYFKIEDQLYRLSRSRNKKGVSDLSLHKRTATDADDSVVFVDVVDKDNSHWKDIASRRTGDTEKDLEKLIKINYKAFRNTVHFVQHDFTGIATLTPEKRKTLLKEVLQIIIYSKLEKMAKDRSADINKEISRLKILLDSLGDPEKEISDAHTQTFDLAAQITFKAAEQEEIKELLESISYAVSEISAQLSSFDEKSVQIKQKENVVTSEIRKVKSTISDYSTKNNSVAASAKNILSEIKLENEKITKLSTMNFEHLSDLEKQLAELQEKTLTEQITAKNLKEELAELKIPIPDDSVCKHCRQPLTDEHKAVCKAQIDTRIVEINNLLANCAASIRTRNDLHSQTAIKISQLNGFRKDLDVANDKVISLKKDYENKKQLYSDYEKIITEQKDALSQKELELAAITSELENYNTDEIKKLRATLEERNAAKVSANAKFSVLNKEITHCQSTLAVLNHKIDQAKDNLVKRKDLLAKITDAEDKIIIYPSVTQAFSSAGIPSLIIQSVLDDWQNEANTLLSQMRPGLQLSFYIEKERDDGEMADTLDIEYFLNNKPREYRQLSGAQRVSIAFALKLGLAFLLQKMFGADIRLLLLDEIDQSLDKAGVDAFADIVKFFQKDFTILVITHNDKLKDKFAHAILVEQDQNMVSKAKVVSSWG